MNTEKTKIPLKHWVLGEAARECVTVSAIYNRMNRGKYPGLELEKHNARVIFVVVRQTAAPRAITARDDYSKRPGDGGVAATRTGMLGVRQSVPRGTTKI